ncbi:hypothetical protein WA1_37985 [Scytonema hofmannii PCC 7110]|uniref:Uncharacterized protein n=1 Tax=Scytonema hofmannii PCC 7110 TaxID=128403 RepID=A0A139X0J5_9CYAN|nr:hypothetical protein [Scytonema hofmannii]KYC38142.1 hypothetical protein WA1_37985 [Scytonema hofmannii PCC 7110]
MKNFIPIKNLSIFFISIIAYNFYTIKLVQAIDKNTINGFRTAQAHISPSHLETIDKTQSSPLTQLEPNPKEQKENNQNQQKTLLDALTVSASKYPWLVNPTDNLTFYPQSFKPNTDNSYFDFDIKFAKENPIIHKFTFALFPKEDQFYWVLPGNRVVFETQGWQGGILYQGKSTDTEITQSITLEQAFGGFQAVSLIPNNFDNLTGDVENQNFSIITIGGQITNPPGIPADKVLIHSGIDSRTSTVTILKNTVPNLGSGSTYSLNGGGSLFQTLNVSNSPRILQGFPTVDLKPLLDDGNVRLAEREIIPKRVLEATGIFWGDPITGKPSQFTSSITSLPGIKVAQLGKFDNTDLLNTLVNPFQTDIERDLHYLNSLYWVSYGQRKPKFNVSTQRQAENDWYRVYFSRVRNNTMIEYNPVNVSASYTNVFANPGISLTLNLENGKINETQSVNSTIGMALGLIFENIDINNLKNHLEDAKVHFKNREKFASLTTKATALQRRQINYRLDRTLSYANLVSGLKQVSGTMTFKSKITPVNSNILQVRTGLYRRGLQFFNKESSPVIEGNTSFSKLRLSNEDFGMLTLIGTQISSVKTTVTPINESASAEIILQHSNGKSFVQQFNLADTETVPIGIKSSDLAFDRIELTKTDRQNIQFRSFNGYLYLPAVEVVYAGSSGHFNYSTTAGFWFNTNSNTAPGVFHNNMGLQEVALGIYSNILLSFQKIDVQRDAKNQPKSIITNASFLNANWNSASNRNNPFSATLSYSYSYQNQNFGFSLTPGIAFTESSDRSEWTKFITTQFSLKTGLECKTTLELGKELFFDLHALQKVNQDISIGAYLKNFSQINLGLDSRASNLNYGIIVKQNFSNNNRYLEAQIGMGEKGFDARLQGGLQF